jgi:hypothetical protein
LIAVSLPFSGHPPLIGILNGEVWNHWRSVLSLSDVSDLSDEIGRLENAKKEEDLVWVLVKSFSESSVWRYFSIFNNSWTRKMLMWHCQPFDKLLKRRSIEVAVRVVLMVEFSVDFSLISLSVLPFSVGFHSFIPHSSLLIWVWVWYLHSNRDRWKWHCQSPEFNGNFQIIENVSELVMILSFQFVKISV